MPPRDARTAERSDMTEPRKPMAALNIWVVAVVVLILVLMAGLLYMYE